MSQRNVESVIGRLATDERFRRRFAAAPGSTLRRLIEEGVDLNECELYALAAIDVGQLETFAGTLHPGIQQVELQGGHS